ncbi:MAG: carboxypeptidase-like regulatory domain-containing protein [Bacteroidota bacterium]|nr:carboxypeptidase-like regulatory domain-containing protein [Bacteroidota bacterium]
MKPKILLLVIGLLGFAFAKANNGPDPSPSTDKKKIDEVNGVIIQVDGKKPLKDVSITAYYLAKKEKTVQTDESGNYSFDELKPGTYKFVFEKAGFKRVTKEKVVVKTDETFQLNIEMIADSDFELKPSAFHFSDF